MKAVLFPPVAVWVTHFVGDCDSIEQARGQWPYTKPPVALPLEFLFRILTGSSNEQQVDEKLAGANDVHALYVNAFIMKYMLIGAD